MNRTGFMTLANPIISRPTFQLILFILLGLHLGGCSEGQAQSSEPPPDQDIVEPTVTATRPPPQDTATPEPQPTPTPLPPAETPTTIPTLTINETGHLPAPTLFDAAWTDRAVFQAGLIETEQQVLNELPGASIYHIDIQIADDLLHLQGQQEVLYTNQENEPLTDIYFRLFPNLAGGSTIVSNVTINDQPVEPAFELQQSAMRLPLSTALQPNEQAVIKMNFAVEIPGGSGGNYGTFAFLDDVLALAHFYPMVAVYDDEGWNIEIAPGIGDVVYADSSFYLVRITAPAAVTVAASGIEINRQDEGLSQIITIAAGPVRDFYLAASERFRRTTRTAGDITINSYAPAEFEAASRRVLDFTEGSLLSFNEHFGPYPFTEFDLVSTTTSALGVEYPGIVAILIDLYEQPEGRLMEAVVAHEVAHQWFYSIIGNDQIDEPWIDEAMAQFATLVYFSDVYGPTAANGFRSSLEGRWERVDGSLIPIGMPVRNYTPQEYGAIVYGRGPLFIEALAEEMGQEAFAAFLLDYYQHHQWDIATGDSFKQLAENHCSCDLTSIFEDWVYDKEH